MFKTISKVFHICASAGLLTAAACSMQMFAAEPAVNEAFEFKLPADSMMNEYKARNTIIETSVFPQVRLGDRYYHEGRYKAAFTAYEHAAEVMKLNHLDSGSYVLKIKGQIERRMANARKEWGKSVFSEAKLTYFKALTEKESKKAIAGYQQAEKLANTSVYIYYTGREALAVKQSQIEFEQRIVKKDSSFQENVKAFAKDCSKMVETVNLREQTSLEAVDPDYLRRNKEIDELYRQAEILYSRKEYAKVRDNIEKILAQDIYNQKAISLLNKVYKRLYKIGAARSANDAVERMVEVQWQWTQPLPPEETQEEIVLQRTSIDSATTEKLQKIIINENLIFADSDVNSIMNILMQKSKELDPEKKGIKIVIMGNDLVRYKQIPYIELQKTSLLDWIKYICDIAGLLHKVNNDGVVEVGVSIGKNLEDCDIKVKGSLIQRIALENDEPAKEEKKTDAKVSEAVETFADKTFSTNADERKFPIVTPEMLKAYFEKRGVSFSGEGASIAFDRKSGKIHMKNTPENNRRMESLLREIDIKTSLVLVEAKIMEVQMDVFEELGFDWDLSFDPTNTDRTTSFSGLHTSTAYSSTNSAPNLVSNLKIIPNFGSGGAFDLSLSIRGIDQKNRSEMIATPRVLVTSGYNAKLKVAEERYFPDDWSDPEVEIVNGTSYSYTPPIPEFSDSKGMGTTFTVKPTVAPNNYTMELQLNVDYTKHTGWSNYDYSIVIGGMIDSRANTSASYETPKIKEPEFSERSMETTVKIYDGETIVIGGVVEDQVSRNADKYPFLGDVPLVGRLFGNDSYNSAKTNLMVFVTARLMQSDGVPVRESRNQGLFNFQNQ